MRGESHDLFTRSGWSGCQTREVQHRTRYLAYVGQSLLCDGHSSIAVLGNVPILLSSKRTLRIHDRESNDCWYLVRRKRTNIIGFGWKWPPRQQKPKESCPKLKRMKTDKLENQNGNGNKNAYECEDERECLHRD